MLRNRDVPEKRETFIPEHALILVLIAIIGILMLTNIIRHTTNTFAMFKSMNGTVLRAGVGGGHGH
jgi:flagellar biosynthesis protein FliQ